MGLQTLNPQTHMIELKKCRTINKIGQFLWVWFK